MTVFVGDLLWMIGPIPTPSCAIGDNQSGERR